MMFGGALRNERVRPRAAPTRLRDLQAWMAGFRQSRHQIIVTLFPDRRPSSYGAKRVVSNPPETMRVFLFTYSIRSPHVSRFLRLMFFTRRNHSVQNIDRRVARHAPHAK